MKMDIPSDVADRLCRVVADFMYEQLVRIRTLEHALTMVRDADEDCKRDGLQTIPPMARATIDAALASPSLTSEKSAP